MKNQKIVNTLNKTINNYQGLSAFCNELSNDTNRIIEMLSKVIKYVFIKKDFVSKEDSLYTILIKMHEIKDLDQGYQEYLNKRLFPPFKLKKIDKNSFSIPLDSDIELKDIEGLRLPSREDIEEICKENLRISKIKEENKNALEKYCNEKKGFNEIGLVYSRPELITIDSSFEYYGAQLSSDVNRDYYSLYNDERYSSNKQTSSPLNDDYCSNIEKIKKNMDISIRKLGNINEIKSGRHRIIYILQNKKPVTIPAKVTRRIEDREFNIILNNLRKKYNIRIYKNNILNDDPNIILIFNNMLYEVKNKNELIIFYNNLRSKINNELNGIPFNPTTEINSFKILSKYKELIFKKYLITGESILKGNFTDVLKLFDEEANDLFYNAYIGMQYEYQSSLIYGYDFKKNYENSISGSVDNTFSYIGTKKRIK